MFSTIEILDIAIGIEQNGEAVYREALEIISEPRLVDLLTWMVDEEVKHARWFSDLKQNVETESENPQIEVDSVSQRYDSVVIVHVPRSRHW